MNMQNIIRTKKEGKALSQDQITSWITGLTDGSIPDYQTSALLMAICFQKMNIQERGFLTLAMANSGETLDFQLKDNFYVDKHSSGGIGDKTSLILAPWLASCGVQVPMISGRGLGFTGGTLDKLEAIPGYQKSLDFENMKKAINNHNSFISGQTINIAPADKKLYALRDVTATIDEISLITGSILSKKLSENLNGLVLDIKCGSGAFMQNLEQAQALAKSLVNTTKESGLECKALITRMDFPLGEMIGNACETAEVLQALQSNSLATQILTEQIVYDDSYPSKLKIIGDQDNNLVSLVFVTTCLALQMLNMKSTDTSEHNLKILKEKWSSGQVLKDFHSLISFQQGSIEQFQKKYNVIEQSWGKESNNLIQLKAKRSGYMHNLTGKDLGNLMIELGAGRKKTSDDINHQVSMKFSTTNTTKLNKGDVILEIYHPNPDNYKEKFNIEFIEKFLENSFEIKPLIQPLEALILDFI